MNKHQFKDPQAMTGPLSGPQVPAIKKVHNEPVAVIAQLSQLSEQDKEALDNALNLKSGMNLASINESVLETFTPEQCESVYESLERIAYCADTTTRQGLIKEFANSFYSMYQ